MALGDDGIPLVFEVLDLRYYIAYILNISKQFLFFFISIYCSYQLSWKLSKTDRPNYKLKEW